MVVLNGFNIAVILVSIVKLLVDQKVVPVKAANWLRALALTLAVATGVVVSQGIFVFPEPWTTLALTCLSTFLGAMGYLPEANGVANAAIDAYRFEALEKVGSKVAGTRDIDENKEYGQAVAQRLLERYGLEEWKK
jgi:hypothetical protein